MWGPIMIHVMGKPTGAGLATLCDGSPGASPLKVFRCVPSEKVVREGCRKTSAQGSRADISELILIIAIN